MRAVTLFYLGKIKPNDNHWLNNEDRPPKKQLYIFVWTQIKSYISIYQLLIWLLSNVPS